MPPPPNNKTPNITNPPMPPVVTTPRSRWKWLLMFVSMLAWVALLLVILVNRQSVADWWRLRDYTPPSAISRLATQDTMSGYTRHLFYLNRPQLLPTVTSFRQFCPENKDTIVLGCYHSNQNGIFIYNVSDPKLAGVQQVTAAHEVLHAVYARLSTKDRNSVDGLLENYYQHDLHDPRVQAEVKLYQQTEPHDVMDEMHSTFGTEIVNLPGPLEAYYKRVFTNRSAIVAYEQRYEGEFTSRQDTIAHDDQQLTTMKRQIDTQEATLGASLDQITAAQSRMNALLNTGQTTAYNDGIPSYNSQVDTYNNGIASLHTAITAYNQLVAARNLVAGQLTTLDNALDTRLPTQATR